MCGRYALSLADDELLRAVSEMFRADREDAANDQHEDGDEDVVEGADQSGLDEASEQSAERIRGGESNVDVRWENEEARKAYRPRYNVAPQTRCVVLRAAPDESALVLSLMKWGLIPHWTKRHPVQPLKTINCRDDTLFSGSGMWSSVRGRHRCIVITEGFYEWLNKDRTKIPHFTKLHERELMPMAGLWDSVTYEGEVESLETFTIITTASSQRLSFLHDRMPAILPDVNSMLTWLAPTPDNSWTKELQQLIQPLDEKFEMDCYPVPKEVGNIRNESSDFIKPVSERKGNLSSFFAKQNAEEDKKQYTKSPSPTATRKPSLSRSPSYTQPKLNMKPSPSPSPRPSTSGSALPSGSTKKSGSYTPASKTAGPETRLTRKNPKSKKMEEGSKPEKRLDKKAKKEGVDLRLNPDDADELADQKPSGSSKLKGKRKERDSSIEILDVDAGAKHPSVEPNTRQAKKSKRSQEPAKSKKQTLKAKVDTPITKEEKLVKKYNGKTATALKASGHKNEADVDGNGNTKLDAFIVADE